MAARGFGRVGVLMGGWSSERDISLQTGAAVAAALARAGVDAAAFDVTRASAARIGGAGFDRVFIALHGRGGEDGAIQGLLETFGIPYTGSGILASALAMNKLVTRRLWAEHALPMPAFSEAHEGDGYEHLSAALGPVFALKPACEGSSIGVGKVSGAAQWPDAWRVAAACGGPVIAETWINGDEYAVALLDRRMLAPIRLQPAREFYDFTAKYEDDATGYHCPCGLPARDIERLQALCLRACDVLGITGWARVDVMRDSGGEFRLLEANTVPGMTGHSLVPMAAAAEGIGFDDLALAILQTAHDAHAAGGRA